MTARLLLVTLYLAVIGASLFAQARSEDHRTNSRMHVGPLHLTPAVSLSEFGFDTNVFNEAGEREKDFTFTVTPRLDTALPFARRGLVRFSTAADFVYYKRYASERSINPNLTLRGEFYLRRVTLFAEPSYVRTRQRPNFEIDVRSRRVEQGTLSGADIRLFPKLSVELSAQHVRTDFDADQFFLGSNLAEALNRVSWTYGVAGRWALTPLTTFVIRGESIKDRFLISETRNSDSARVAAGLELKPRALISGRAQLGVRRLEGVNFRVPDFTGPFWSVGLSHTLMGSTSFAFTADRDARFSFEVLEPYYVETAFGAIMRRQLAGRFDAIGGFHRYRYDYRDLLLGTDDVSPAKQTRIDIIYSYSGSIGYRIGSAGRLGFGFAYSIRESNRHSFRNYDGLRIGTSFTSGL